MSMLDHTWALQEPRATHDEPLRASAGSSRPLAGDVTVAGGLATAGAAILRYGLVAILVYFGAFKFTAVEADAIRPLVTHSPLLSWLYGVLSVQGVSDLIGTTEILFAALVALRPVAPRLAALGSLGAAGTFVTTLSFLVTTPGIWQHVPGFPVAVPSTVGAFLLKDVFLLGAAVWTAGDGWNAANRSISGDRDPAAGARRPSAS
jgi:reactive chlorine resistance protein C